jgi:hypothetical protein
VLGVLALESVVGDNISLERCTDALSLLSLISVEEEREKTRLSVEKIDRYLTCKTAHPQQTNHVEVECDRR